MIQFEEQTANAVYNTMLRTNLAELYLKSAKDLFVQNLTENVSETTTIDLQIIEADRLSARCNARDEDAGSTVGVTVSTKCLENLSSDLSLNDESQNAFFEWRLSWLVWHELAHWLLGHISVYREEGWIGDLGIHEEHLPDAVQSVSEGATNQDMDVFALAHVAELEADSFATLRLYQLLVDIPVNDDAHGDTPEEDIQFCYYTIMTTISCFFASSRGNGRGPFHPSWNVRSLNVFTTLFHMHLERQGREPAALLGADVSELATQANSFMRDAIQPTIDGIEAYAQSIGCPFQIHGNKDEGLFDPASLLDVYTGGSRNPVVRAYLDLLDQQPAMVNRTYELRSERTTQQTVIAKITQR